MFFAMGEAIQMCIQVVGNPFEAAHRSSAGPRAVLSGVSHGSSCLR
jgi:hypothetical protein